MKKVCLLFLVLFGFTQFSTGQLLEEYFNYSTGALITESNGNWTAFASEGSTPVQVNAGALTYTGYPSTGIGESVTLVGNPTTPVEDVKRHLTSTLNENSVYLSFILNITDVIKGNDEYFISFQSSANGPVGGYIFAERKNLGNTTMRFGVGKGTSVTYTGYDYALGTTYLIVLKYTFNTVSGTDDVVSLFVNPTLTPPTEPASTISGIGSGIADLSDIEAVVMYQATANNMQIDGIRVGTTWDQAPLPVELNSFTASVANKGVILNWSTATEVNNYGFEIERSVADSWKKIGFVEGHGNSYSPKDYSFYDSTPLNGDISYRLKQVDIDGAFEYSDEAAVTLKGLGKVVLNQNHPNPFNPSTAISFSLPEVTYVKVLVYNAIGQEVAELANGEMEAGSHSVDFNGSNLTSGMYFYRLETASYSKTMKMMLIK